MSEHDEYGHEIEWFHCPGCGQQRLVDGELGRYMAEPVQQSICDECDNVLDRLRIIGEAMAEAAREGTDARTLVMDVLSHLSEESEVL